ncbi:MAG: DUF3109 family protein [Lewinellaceae bacterium]|nr:DUF3109 family protein [Lewinella sp.]MCB9278300.1 DUF3109 family protein [Lewinellaceae bacterium]
MILIGDILISDEVVTEQFICNLEACKGACCREGDYGAPLDEEELEILKQIYPLVRPYLTEEGRAAIDRNGPYAWIEEAEEFGTTLLDGAGPCAFMTTNEAGVAQCGIEQAWKAGAVDFRKPVSCHLYPIRVNKNAAANFESLNYDRWDICSAACTLGRKEKVPVYRFLEEAIVRRYGREFYEELDQAAQFHANTQTAKRPDK